MINIYFSIRISKYRCYHLQIAACTLRSLFSYVSEECLSRDTIVALEALQDNYLYNVNDVRTLGKGYMDIQYSIYGYFIIRYSIIQLSYCDSVHQPRTLIVRRLQRIGHQNY